MTIAAIIHVKTNTTVMFVEDRNLDTTTVIRTWLKAEGINPDRHADYRLNRGPVVMWDDILNRAGE